jgi:hypothetical protein
MYGTATKDAADKLGGTSTPPFVEVMSTPFTRSHVYAFVGVAFVFAN